MRARSVVSNTLVLAAAIALVLAMAEIATRLFYPQPLTGSWMVYGPQGILMNRAGGAAVRHEMPGKRVVTYAFNSWHQRGREEPDPRAARVLVLGDSFTFGFGLKLDDTYVSGLQRRLDAKGARGARGARGGDPHVQLLNASTGGWGTADELVYLEAFGDRLGLSAVVVFVSFGDASRSIDQALFEIRPDRQGLTPVEQPSGRSTLKRMLEGNRLYAFLLEHSQLLQLVRGAAMKAGEKKPTVATRPSADEIERKSAAEQELFGLLLRRMAAWCTARDIPLTVVTTGWPIFHFEWLAPMAREEGVYFRDLHDAVASAIGNRLDDYIIARDGHPNEAGARLVEAAAWPVLDERLTALPHRPLGGR